MYPPPHMTYEKCSYPFAFYEHDHGTHRPGVANVLLMCAVGIPSPFMSTIMGRKDPVCMCLCLCPSLSLSLFVSCTY